MVLILGQRVLFSRKKSICTKKYCVTEGVQWTLIFHIFRINQVPYEILISVDQVHWNSFWFHILNHDLNFKKPNYFKKQSSYHHFYLPKVIIIQVQIALEYLACQFHASKT